jgi:hypothetical protein
MWSDEAHTNPCRNGAPAHGVWAGGVDGLTREHFPETADACGKYFVPATLPRLCRAGCEQRAALCGYSQRRAAGGQKRMRCRACSASLLRAHRKHLSGFLPGLSRLPVYQCDLRFRQKPVWKPRIFAGEAGGDSGRHHYLSGPRGNYHQGSSTGSKCALKERQ